MTVANSIDATLDAVNTDESMTIDRVLPDLEKSLEFQRLLNLHMTRFYTRTDVAIPERIRVAVMHSFWLGMECGRAAKTEAAVAIQPKPQIPTMLAALRREREKARLLLEALESKLAPVTRAADEIPTGIPVSVRWDKAAPIAETLDESVNIFAALNARIKDVTARLEI